MPYKSSAQRAYMHAQHPQIAARWDKENPKNARSKSLPKHVGDQSRKPKGGGGGQFAGYVASPTLRERRDG